MRCKALFVLWFLCLLPAKSHAEPRLTLGACTDPKLPKDARCGTYEVCENRAAKTGRKIPLRVAVLPALGPDRLPDPVVYFNGGPGNSAVQVARGLAQSLAPLRRRRDILLVDFRGTGGSAPLDCPELLGSGSVQEWLDSYRPADKVRACRDRLSRTVDLTQYTTDNAIDDVDEVRAALGYPQLNLTGSSYGSRAVLVYLRRHPDKVRTAILDGVAQTHDRGPLFFARTAQRALDALVAECAEDAACARAFPHLKDEVTAVFERVGREPVSVGLVDAKTGERREVRLSRSGVAQVVRYMLYESDWALEVPLLLHQAAQGDWKPLAEKAVWMAGLSRGVAPDGDYLSITCSEDVPFIRDEEIPAAVAGTFLGDFRIRQQREACAVWKVPKVPASYLEPVVSDVPALVVNHGRDPVTPASDGEEAARTLRRSRVILVPYAGHSTDGLEGVECLDTLWVKLIEAGSADRLDTSCVAKIRRPAFVLGQGKSG
jgi:pimeloyl-ACP methyl ester carboxylesterase